MSKLHFTLSELCIITGSLPQDVADKLLQHHIWPMNPVREELDAAVLASDNSGYRPTYYDKARGRSGNSQHCFEGKGAVDWTTRGDMQKLILLIMKLTSYTRICYYPNNRFVHCDYKPVTGGRQYFECASPTSAWKYKETVDEYLK